MSAKGLTFLWVHDQVRLLTLLGIGNASSGGTDWSCWPSTGHRSHRRLGAAPLGAFAGCAIADATSVRWAIAVLGVGVLVSAAAWCSPLRHVHEIPGPTPLNGVT